jgi:membrane-associated protein
MDVGFLQLAAHHHRFHGSHLDYFGVAIGAFVSWLGISGPGEAAMIAAGVLASRGKVDLASVIAVGWGGAVLGGIAGWGLGLRGGRALFTAPGPLRRTRARMLRTGDRFYERYAVLAVYFAPTIMAGINGMRPRRFLPINAVACLVWALLTGIGAYYIGKPVEDVLGDIGVVGLIVLGVLIVVALVANRIRRRRKLAG